MDESGEHINDFDHDVYKERLDPNGNAITAEKSDGKDFFFKKKLFY